MFCPASPGVPDSAFACSAAAMSQHPSQVGVSRGACVWDGGPAAVSLEAACSPPGCLGTRRWLRGTWGLRDEGNSRRWFPGAGH